MAHNEIAFHGTIEPYAEKILAEQHFHFSRKSNEWLGFGVYFFPHRSHADWWASNQSNRHGQSPAVLSVTLQYEDAAFFNLDLNENARSLHFFSEDFLHQIQSEGKLKIHFDNLAELRCLCIEAFKVLHPEIKLIAYTFDAPGHYDKWLYPPKQLQYCVVDHSIIRDIKLVSKGGASI